MSYRRTRIDYPPLKTSITFREPAQLAIKHLRFGDVDRARAVLDVAIVAAPQDAKLHELLGVIEYEHGDAFKGIEHLEIAIALPSADAGTWSNCAHVLNRMGQHAKALKYYDQALALAPDYAEAYCGKANHYLENEDWERAYDLYNKSVGLEPLNPSYYNNRGVAALKLGMVGQALLDAQQANTLEPLDLYQINLADAYVAAGQVSVALATLAQVSEAGRDSGYYTVLGKVHGQSGVPAAAIASFQKAFALNEYHLDAYEECAAAYYSIDDSVSARYCIRQCLDIKPESLRYRYLDCLYAIPIREASVRASEQAQHRFVQKVDRLQKWLDKKPRPLAAINRANFVAPLYFLYSSENSLRALQKYHELQKLRALDECVDTAEVSNAICIVTAKANDAEYAGLCLYPLLRSLSKSDKAVHLLSVGVELNVALQSAAVCNVIFDLEEALETIAQIRPKAIIYTDIASSYLPYALASMRLAPLQLQTWNAGCGVFSETIDGLLAPDFFAGGDYADVELEKLVFYRQQFNQMDRTRTVDRQTTGSTDAARFILCAANSLKYQGEYVELLLDLLQQHADARAIISSDYGYRSLHLKTHMLERAVSRGLKDPERIVFASGDLPALLATVPSAKAVVLDAFPYSDFATVQAALGLQMPVLALNGPELHGQLGAQLMRALGLAPMLVATNLAEYATLCQRLMGDEVFYAQALEQVERINGEVEWGVDAATACNSLEYILEKL